jgi:hypothetical protein
VSFPSIRASAKGGSDFKPVPAGVHFAVCSQVIDLGVQKTTFKGQDKQKHQVYIRFELPDTRVTWGKEGSKQEGSATIGRTFTLSIGEMSNLRPFLTGWRGKEFTAAEQESFEITSIVGKVCQLSVVHETGGDGKVRAQISGAFPIIKEQREALTLNPARGQASKLVVYSPAAHDAAVWETLPNWIQEKINGRIQEQAPVKAEDVSQAEDFNDDIPF